MQTNAYTLNAASRIALACILLLFAAATARSREIQHNEADSEPMEYTTVAAFVQGLPMRKDVEAMRGLPLEPGMLAYQTTAAAVIEDPAFSARTWLIFTPPHPMAPSVARLRTYLPEHELHRRRQAWATLCESTTEGCARMNAYLRRVLGGVKRDGGS
ncbi:hypothetical protein [Stenotrophomonas sp. TWI819]|uniref:hypothetical protein n=1 Tax=Stenotrophomonas sp. TWI819 TaxID=3136800 RepID=UPI0032095ABD